MTISIGILLTLLLAACCSTTGSGNGGAPSGNTGAPSGNTGASPTAGSTPTVAATAPGSQAPESGTPGVDANGPQCAGQSALTTIRMVDSVHGWAMNEQAILKTSDGGVHWQCVQPAGLKTLGRAVGRFADMQHAWVIPQQQSTNAITVLRTSDGGAHWLSSTINGEGIEVLEPPHFFGDQGWLEIVTNGGPGAGSESVAIYHTTDAGAHWSQIATTEGNSGLVRGGIKSGISFKDALNGWATGVDASNAIWLYVTHDGGRSWQHQNVTGLPTTNQSSFQTTPPVFIGNTGLLPIRYSDANLRTVVFAISNDGGQTWAANLKSPGPAINVDTNGVYIVDQQHAWMVDNNTNALFRTADGGASWQKLGASLGSISSLSFINANTGWAISQQGLSRTDNGGESWQHIDSVLPA